MTEKVKLVLFNIGLAVTIFGSLYWFTQKWERDIQERIDTVNRNYEYANGIITDLQSYKGRTIQVKYQVKDNKYEATVGWDKNPKSLGEGDSIRIKYSVEKPDLIISELENEY